MRHLVELLLIAQGAFAALLLCGAYAGAWVCRRHRRRAVAALNFRRVPAPRAPGLRASGSSAPVRAPAAR